MLMYGSSFMFATFRPRFSSSAPIDALARPLPSDETTPPVTKMYLCCFDIRCPEYSFRAGLRVNGYLPPSPTLESRRARPDLKHVGPEFRSRHQLFGLPIVHVAWGVDPFTGRLRVARGLVAVGPVALGLIAVGPIAVGPIAVGLIAAGLFAAAGQIAAGLSAAGQVAFGGLLALGELAP